jgi:sulfite exporter TauE/SafE
MRTLATLARWEGIILLLSFGVVTVWRLLASGSFAGLIRSSDGTLSPGRIQLLVLTVMTALQYVLATIADPSHLPSLPSNLEMALGGSQALYLGAKAWSTFAPKRNNLEKT